MKVKYLVLAKDLETGELFKDEVQFYCEGEEMPDEEDVALAFYKQYPYGRVEIKEITNI